MQIELQAVCQILRKWKENPSASKEKIGVFSGWKEEKPVNKKPLSEKEVNRLKSFCKQNDSLSYLEIFPEENVEFFTAQELAEKLRVNIMTIYRYIKSKKIKAYKIGKEYRIKKMDFDHFLDNTKIK